MPALLDDKKPEARPRHANLQSPMRSSLPSGWPLLAAFWLYPLWWLLGVQVLAVPLGAALACVALRRRRYALVAPRWVGIWFIFLAWTVASAITLQSGGRFAAWLYRDLGYLTGLSLIVALTTAPGLYLSTARIARMAYALWAFTVVGGLLGITLPQVQFPSLMALILPTSIDNNGLIHALVNPRFGETSAFYGVPRPVALFPYTNDWGAALGVLTPVAVYARRHLRSAWSRATFWLLAALSVIPIIVSVNRGLWISIGVVAVVILVQAFLHGRTAIVLALTLTVTALATVVWISPLEQVIANRMQTENVSTRQTLVNGALTLVSQSPVLGAGAPVQTNLNDANGVSVGTHGQLWTILVSQGLPGAAFYIAFFVFAVLSLRKLPAHAWWLQAAVITLLAQMPFYNSDGLPLQVAMIAIALGVRELTGNAEVDAGTSRQAANVTSTHAGDIDHSILMERNRFAH